MIIISAMSEDRVIGDGDGMPWDVPAEYQQYLRFVGGHTVIMGRKSYEIFAPDLPDGTTKIVISRSSIDGATVANSLDKALAIADSIGKTVFVAGGASVYAQAIPLADEMYLSTIKGHFRGATCFPEFDTHDWTIVEEREEAEFIFRRYCRVHAAKD